MRPDGARKHVPEPAGEELMALLAAATGNARLGAADSPVLAKVRSRLTETGLPSFAAYLKLLKEGSGGRRELEALIAQLTVGETFFFRQGEHFAALRDAVLPAVLERNAASRQLRIWSAGCANGAEPYSIAITIHRLMGDDLAGWDLTIIASDINRAFLEEAEAATYTAWTLRGVQPADLKACFTPVDGAWRVRNRYRRLVRFVKDNLIGGDGAPVVPAIRDFDIVFCRNVMLYFDDTSNARAMARLSDALVPGGYLFVAPTDISPRLEATFVPDKAGVVVYRKPGAPGSVVAPPAAPVPDRRRPRTRTERPAPGPRRARPNAPRASSAPAPATALDLIVALADRGEFAEALRQTASMLAAEPLNVAAHYYAALVSIAVGNSAGAEAALSRAIYLDRTFALAHYHLALLRAEAGDRAAARKGMETVVALLADAVPSAPVSPGGEVDAAALRALATGHLQHWGAP